MVYGYQVRGWLVCTFMSVRQHEYMDIHGEEERDLERLGEVDDRPRVGRVSND